MLTKDVFHGLVCGDIIVDMIGRRCMVMAGVEDLRRDDTNYPPSIEIQILDENGRFMTIAWVDSTPCYRSFRDGWQPDQFLTSPNVCVIKGDQPTTPDSRRRR